MEFQTYVSWISSPVQIAFLDLVLGADNAVIIALVCRSLPRHQRMNVMIVGTGAAMLLRIVLTAVTGALMFAPVLRLAGGFVLMLIAISLTDELDVGPVPEEPNSGSGDVPRDAQAESEAFWDAILLVTLADGVMSLDNTVALAAVANGDMIYLVLGLALSVPTLVFGSWLLSELLGGTPFLATIAMAVLGWIAGDMGVSDPLVADWIKTTAPALTFGVPLACVIFVLGKAAFKPVIVPLPVVGPFAGFALAEPGVEAKPIELESQPVPVQPMNAPVAADEPEMPLADREAPKIPPQSKPVLGERLVIIGLIVLFGIAAIIMSTAIYFGGATF